MENLDINSTLPYLTLDLITNILLRLPAKPLARFKCVSKAWNALITSRKFILTHIARASKTLSNLHMARINCPKLYTLPLTVYYPPTSPTETPHTQIKLPFTSAPLENDFFGTAHGLVGINEFPKFISLYNPTNKTFHVIKPVTPKTRGTPIHESHWHDFSLGYDPLSDDYKIVMVTQPNQQPSPRREVWVYSLKNPTWRKLNQEFPLYLAYSRCNTNGKYLSNCNSEVGNYYSSLLWVAAVRKPEVYGVRTMMDTNFDMHKKDNVYFLVEFDLATEKFNVGELPGFDTEGNYFGFRTERRDTPHESPRPSLSVSGSDLFAQVEFGPTEERVVEIWLRRDYGGIGKKSGNWIKLIMYPYMSFLPQKKMNIAVKPVRLSEDGEDLLIEQMNMCSWINLKTGKRSKAEIPIPQLLHLRMRGGDVYSGGGVVYVESLVQLGNVGIKFASASKDDSVPITFDPAKHGNEMLYI